MLMTFNYDTHIVNVLLIMQECLLLFNETRNKSLLFLFDKQDGSQKRREQANTHINTSTRFIFSNRRFLFF